MEEDKEKTAFTLRSGKYEWNVLPMGHTNSPAAFQRTMQHLFKDLLGTHVHVFIDDILIFTEDVKTHLEVLEKVFKILDESGMKLNVKKSNFFLKEIEYLGFIINDKKVKHTRNQVKAILDMFRPEDITALRSFTGMCNVFRWMIKDYATIIGPLEELKKKGKNVLKD